MLTIPKVVGVMSCGFLLCLGLSGTAALATDEMQPGQSPERIGGQAGVKGAEEKLKGEAGYSAAPRIGGQAGLRGDGEKLEGEAGYSAAPRIGGQAGLKGAEEKLMRSPTKK
jgi:hypothetical protein